MRMNKSNGHHRSLAKVFWLASPAMVALLLCGCRDADRPELPATEPATNGAAAPAPAGPTFIATLGAPIVPGDAIEPADGATVRGTETFIRWHAPLGAQGRVMLRPADNQADFISVPAAPAESAGDPLVAHVTALAPGDYEYAVEHVTGGLAQRSRTRSLIVEAGPRVAFTPAVVEQTIKRDYSQLVTLRITNDTPEHVTIAAQTAVHFPDLPADVVGTGSIDEPAELPPGSSLDLSLMLAAPDARRKVYDIPVEAAGIFGVARVHIDNPKLQLSMKILAEDPRTLAKTIEIRNDGSDVLTDLSLSVAPPNEGDVRLEPLVTHAMVPARSSVQLTVAPVLYLEFESLSIELVCSAAGQTKRFSLALAAPADKRLVGVRHASSETNKATSWYCTNKPDVCTPVPAGQGNGPLKSVMKFIGIGGDKGDCNCDIEQACETIAQIKALIARYTAADPRYNNFREFMTAFDDLFRDLSNKDLACRYVPNPNIPAAQVETIIQGIRRARHSFQSASDGTFMPSRVDCSYEVDSVFPRTPEKERKCHDYHAIVRVDSLLDDLAATLGCPPPPERGGRPFNPCPELGSMDDIKEKLDQAGTQTDRASKLTKNPKAKAALEKAAKVLKFITRHLGKILQGKKYCAMLRELLDILDRLDRAQTPEENARAFDELFRHLFKWGEEFLPWPFNEYTKDLQDTTLFEDLSRSLAPDERWKRQFEGIDQVGEENR